MSSPPPPPPTQFYETQVSGDHPGLPQFANASPVTINDPNMDPVQKAQLEKAITERLRNMNLSTVTRLSTGPLSFSGKGMPFVRPQLEHMLQLAVPLGLEKEGGWKEVWERMDREKEALCKLVRTVLEWNRKEGTDGNTFEYCFCTKYLPQVVTSVLNEPRPSVFSSPFDLILHGAATSPLLPYYLSLHPDLAIKLRNLYFEKVLDAFKLNLGEKYCYSHLYPRLSSIHVCAEAYVFSKASTPSQRAPPLPLSPPLEPAIVANAGAVVKRLQNLFGEGESLSKPWEKRFPLSFLVFIEVSTQTDIRVKYPEFQDSMSATGWEFCRHHECMVRDAAKMKACSRCRVSRYCSTEHQKKDWIRHKPFCQPLLWDA